MNAIELVSGEASTGRVFRVHTDDGRAVEVVDSTRPAERGKRRVFGLSTMLGCPIRCAICDAGGGYLGRLTEQEMLSHLDFLVESTFPGGKVDVEELVVELTRMGEPSFNDDVLAVLLALPGRYGAVRVRPFLSSVGPAGAEAFFEALLGVKARAYPKGGLGVQFSLHTTDEVARAKVVPVRRWSFAAIAAWSRRFVGDTGEKVALGFPATTELPIDPAVLAATFSPDVFRVRLTPLNPSEAATRKGFEGLVGSGAEGWLVDALELRGFDVEVEASVDLHEATGCGRYFSQGLGPTTPRRTHVRE